MTLEEFYARAHDIGVDIAGHFSTLRETAAGSQLVIEVGVGNGNSSSAFLLGLMESGGRLWSVDIIPTEYSEELQRLCPEWEYHIGDSLELEPSAPYGADVLFIDSDHTYESTKAELLAYREHLRPGGVIFLHDTGPHQPGVRQAIEELYGEGWSNNPNCFGLGTIQT